MDSHTAATGANLSRPLSELNHCNDGESAPVIFSYTVHDE